MEVLVWMGDPMHCNYCRDAVFPHEHVDPDAEQPVASRQKVRKPVAVSSGPRRKPTRGSGRRGRPMKPENIDLLKLCECRK